MEVPLSGLLCKHIPRATRVESISPTPSLTSVTRVIRAKMKGEVSWIDKHGILLFFYDSAFHSVLFASSPRAGLRLGDINQWAPMDLPRLASATCGHLETSQPWEACLKI